MISCTVVLVQYNPDKEKLMRTLSSIIKQKDVSIQIIIADDCSETDYFTDIEMFLKENGFNDYCFSKNERNKGTVLNILNALNYAKGEYISLISPGDYYYNETTLSDVINKMKSGNYEFLFGRLSPYQWVNGELNLVQIQFPYFIKPYKDYMSTGDCKKIRKYLIVYHDTMVGASLFWEKSLLIAYLKRIAGKVLYVEDIVPIYVLLDHIRFAFLDRYLVWYEYGTGISTARSSEMQKKIDVDIYRFYYDLAQRYPAVYEVKRAKLLGHIIGISGIKSKILRSVLFPDRFCYLFTHKVLLKERNAPLYTEFIKMLYEGKETACKS